MTYSSPNFSWSCYSHLFVDYFSIVSHFSIPLVSILPTCVYFNFVCIQSVSS